jgi:hypothetical protein
MIHSFFRLGTNLLNIRSEIKANTAATTLQTDTKTASTRQTAEMILSGVNLTFKVTTGFSF